MLEKYHNFKFRIKEISSNECVSEYHKVKICTKKLDNETYLCSTNSRGNYTLYLQDRFFNFSVDTETKDISSFEGDLNIEAIKFTKIQMPKHIINAILSLDTEEILQKGCGGYIWFNTSKIYYDQTQKILQIGNFSPKEKIFKFFQNGFAQIKKGNLVSLIFTEIEL